MLDPTRDDPRQHLRFHVDRTNIIDLVYPTAIDGSDRTDLPDPDDDPNGLAAKAKAVGVSHQGMVSIQVYGLNRLSLVQARTKVLRDLEFLFHLSIDLAVLVQELDDRIASQRARLQQADSPQTKDDMQFNERIRARLARYVDDIRARLRGMSDKRSPYSELARAWVRGVLDPT